MWSVVILVLYVIPANHAEVIAWVEENTPAKVCCTLQPEVDGVIEIRSEDLRIQTLVNKGGVPERHRNSETEFQDIRPGWNADPVGQENMEMCLTKSIGAKIIEDDNMTINCETKINFGWGMSSGKEDIVLKVHQLPQVTDFTSNVEVTEGESVELDCGATGFPNLRIMWRAHDNDTILAETNLTGLDTRGHIRLTIPSVMRTQQNKTYVCEALTGYPDGEVAQARTALEVLFQPTISMPTDVIYTKLGVPETLEVVVSGHPTPTLDCGGLYTSGPVGYVNGPQGETYTYRIRIDSVEKELLGNVTCEAQNKVGVTRKSVLLTIGPSPPVILSPNETSYADYYLLHWETNSRIPLKNVTVQLNELVFKNNASEVTLNSQNISLPLENVNSSDTRISIRYPVEDIPDSTYGPHHPDRWVWSVTQHLSRLNSNTQYTLKVIVCNRLACAASADNDGQGTITFQTPEFNGSNKIDRKTLDDIPKVRSGFKVVHKSRNGAGGMLMAHWNILAIHVFPILLNFL